MVYPIAHIDVKPPRLTKERFVAGDAAAVAVTGRVVLGIRFRFHNHAPEQLAIRLAFHQQTADGLGTTSSAGRAKKLWGRCWEGVVAMGVAREAQPH